MRLARLFVDDRNAAEDLVQEAFIRLRRAAPAASATTTRRAAYLRSIVLNLARDHNRRGLVSLRHHLPRDEPRVGRGRDRAARRPAARSSTRCATCPHRQRNCLVLRYYDELGIDEIAETLGISRTR